MSYTEGFKKEVVKKLLLQNNTGINELSRELGIDRKTIYTWRKKYNCDIVKDLKDTDLTPEDWPFEYKFSIMLEALEVPTENFGIWLRENGVKEEHINKWRGDFMAIAKQKDNNNELKEAKARIKELEKELKIKEKALAEASVLLVLKKKFNMIWEEEDVK